MYFSSSLNKKIESALFFLLLFFLPTQLGKHFWPDFSFILGIRVDYLSPTIYITDILLIVLFVVWLINSIRDKKNFFPPRVFIIATTILLSTAILSTFIVNSIYHVVKFFEFSFLGFYIAQNITSEVKVKKVVLILALACLYESALALAQFINQGSLNTIFYFLGERTFTGSTPGIANASINGELLLRPYASFSHPNVLAGFLVSCMLLSFWAYGKVKNVYERIGLISCLFIGTAALLLTMSRAAIVLWIVFLIIVLIRVKIKKTVNKFIFLLGFVFLFVMINVTPFGIRLFSTRLTEEAVVQRQELITSSLTIFRQSPIVGVGIGNFLYYLPTVQKPLSVGMYIQPVHNIFLLLLTETGILGFSVFLWMIVKTYKHLFHQYKTHFIFIILLTNALLLGMVDHYFLTLQQGQLLFAVILGLCWTTYTKTNRERSFRD